jgi:hypothetical protein
MATTKRKIALGRLIALGIAAALTVFAVNATIAANHLSGRFAKWQTDRPVDALVDLSKPGTTTMPFVQTCYSAHSEEIFLEAEGVDMTTTDALQNLAGTLSIDDNGEPLVTANLADIGTFTDAGGNHKFFVTSFFPFGPGTYTLKLQIDRPAEPLATHPQRLTAQYRLCGMEQYPEILTQFFAIVSWLLVAAFGIPSTIGLFRYGLRAKP